MRFCLPIAVSLCLLAPAGAFAATINLDFSSGTFFDRPPGVGDDLYMQDGFTVEILDVTHNTTMPNACPSRWCFDNNFTAPAEVTLITRDDGGFFDPLSVQVLAFGNGGVTFTAGGKSVNKMVIGTVDFLGPEFGPEFQGISVLRIDIPCSGGFNSCAVTIDNVNIVPEPSTAALTALGLVGLAWRRRIH